jgi:hypothetical protein
MRGWKRALVSGAASVVALVTSGCDLSWVNVTGFPPKSSLQGPPIPGRASGRSRPGPAARPQVLLAVVRSKAGSSDPAAVGIGVVSPIPAGFVRVNAHHVAAESPVSDGETSL